MAAAGNLLPRHTLAGREHFVKALKVSSKGFLWLEIGQNTHSADTSVS